MLYLRKLFGGLQLVLRQLLVEQVSRLRARPSPPALAFALILRQRA